MPKSFPSTYLIPGLLALAAPLAHAAAPAASSAVDSGAVGLTTDAASFGPYSSVVSNPAPALGAEDGGFYGGGATALGGGAGADVPRRPAVSGTPLLDQATIDAQRREERRRASGHPPRIIGIAPRTNADRTGEMPDDPIIRY